MDALEERAELERSQRKADLVELAALPAGRRLLERLVFEFGGLQAQPHHPDPYQRAFNDGQRQVAIELDRELYLATQDGWALMHAERVERLRTVQLDPKPNKTDD